jgi:branched-chain amino acid transport system ATP-binding protein
LRRRWRAGLFGSGIGLVPQGRRIFPSLDVFENLTLGFDGKAQGQWTLERIFELFPQLAGRRRQPARTLSGGDSRCWRSRALCL